MTADEVVAEVAQDIAFYGDDGGITLSGGEPLCQREFSAAILERCKASGLRAAIETNLACEWAHFAPLIPLLDLVMLDLKAFDPELHRRGTGATNVRILDNARRLAGTGLDLIARTPVIPGYNDDPDEIASIARYIAPLPGVLYYELLPYHPLGVSKHASLGLDDPTEIPAPPNAECIDRLAEAARAAGVAVRVAGRGPHSTSSANPDSQIYAYTCLLYQEVLM
jgi:pyruvate formate lyase activating enzyme